MGVAKWTRALAFCLFSLALLGCGRDGSSAAQEPENGSSKAEGHGVYEFGTGVNAMFVFDTEENQFFCVTSHGGSTTGSDGNFSMVITTTPPLTGVVYDTVMIGGEPKNRVRFSGNATTTTVNNGNDFFPGDQGGGEPEVLFDELAPCVVEVEAVDDPVGGDRWRVTIVSGSTLFPDGTTFQNFSGDDITAGATSGLAAGDITVTP
jgi:hypothetical protein